MILSANAISCRRGSRSVFRDVSFTLNSGQIMAVTGANGSGKSTLLRLLAGLNDPVDGDLRLDGAPFSPDLCRDSVRWIGPDCPLKPSLSVLENLSFWAAMQGNPGDRDSIIRALHRLEIAALADRAVCTLSSGQKRRVALSRLFLGHRALWLLDEPEAALDREGHEMAIRALHEHCGSQGSAIIATHHPELWRPTFMLELKAGRGSTGHIRLAPSDAFSAPRYASPRALTAFGATLRRDLLLAGRSGADCLQPVLLFFLLSLLFPLALGPDAAPPVAAGLIIMAALFSSLLPLERIFSDDAADGTIETLMTTPGPLPLYSAGRIATHILTSNGPVILLSPLVAAMFGVEANQLLAVPAVLLPVMLLFSMIGATISALALSARRGSVLLSLLAAPLYIPALVFGAGALDMIFSDISAAMPITLLWAMIAVFLPLSPLLAAGCLSLMRD
ncbi:MAG TPA: heme ABC exporter ATP-binding protein CcmA [Micavibrio sp.]|jgi:heme exporter protein B